MKRSIHSGAIAGFGHNRETRIGWAIASAVVALAVIFAAASPARPANSTKTVNARIRDTGITLSAESAPVGTVIFRVKNTGKFNHNFKVAGKKTPVLKPGKTARLTVGFKKPGKYGYSSTLPGDAHRGLRGTFKLTGATKPLVNGNVGLGKIVFQSTCSVCHTLKAAAAVGKIGPDFDRLKLPYTTIVNTATNGKTGSKGTMPSYKGSLTSNQIKNVAAFIYASEHS